MGHASPNTLNLENTRIPFEFVALGAAEPESRIGLSAKAV
jgi:hypothetical protein